LIQETPLCQAIEIFTDDTGIYRTFEAKSDNVAQTNGSTASRSTAVRSGQQSHMQLTQQQIKRLQDEKPAISTDMPNLEIAMHTARVSQWLATLSTSGELQVR